MPEESEWARAKAEELTDEFVCGSLLSLLLTGGKPVLDAVTGEDAEREVLDYLALLGIDKDAARPYVPELVRTAEAARETTEKIDRAGEKADAGEAWNGLPSSEDLAAEEVGVGDAYAEQRLEKPEETAIIRNEISPYTTADASESDLLQLSSHNLHNSSDVMYERSKGVVPIPGYDDVFCHGDAWGVSTKDANGNDIPIPEGEFIKTLRSLKLENNAIRLCACDTGAQDDGFASFLAKVMNKRVMAPTTKIWITMPDKNGITEMQLYESLDEDENAPDYDKPGRWRIFNLDGSVEEVES